MERLPGEETQQILVSSKPDGTRNLNATPCSQHTFSLTLTGGVRVLVDDDHYHPLQPFAVHKALHHSVFHLVLQKP